MRTCCSIPMRQWTLSSQACSTAKEDGSNRLVTPFLFRTIHVRTTMHYKRSLELFQLEQRHILLVGAMPPWLPCHIACNTGNTYMPCHPRCPKDMNGGNGQWERRIDEAQTSSTSTGPRRDPNRLGQRGWHDLGRRDWSEGRLLVIRASGRLIHFHHVNLGV